MKNIYIPIIVGIMGAAFGIGALVVGNGLGDEKAILYLLGVIVYCNITLVIRDWVYSKPSTK